jgi:hypothetical protein
MVTAGDAKVTGDVSTPLVVYKSWECVFRMKLDTDST